MSFMQIAKQARNERGQKLFQIFRQEENEVSQLKGLVDLERRCQELMQEVELLSERQEVLTSWKTTTGKRRRRSDASVLSLKVKPGRWLGQFCTFCAFFSE